MASSCSLSGSLAAVAAAVSGPRLATTKRSSYNLLPRRRFSIPSLSLSSFRKHLPSESRLSTLRIRASSEETSNSEVNEIFTDLKEKWDSLEDKSIVLLYGGGAVVGIWLSSAVVGSIDSIPLLPKFMELVGLGYTGWFIYRYLIFKSSRKELATEIEAFKNKIMGNE